MPPQTPGHLVLLLCGRSCGRRKGSIEPLFGILKDQHGAVDWLLATKDQARWPEALRAAQSYTEAKESCLVVQRQLDVLQLQAGLPDRSRCEICQDWAGN